jgi:hypothetical protein
MSDLSSKETATTVTPNPVDDEKHNSTSRSPSLHSHPSSPLPEVAPVLDAVGFVLEPTEEPTEKPQATATAFEDHPSQPPAENEKAQHVVEENGSAEDGSARTGEPIVQHEGEAGVDDAKRPGQEEAEEEIDYPSGLKLGLLTFGLCMATFTVALDNTIIASKLDLFSSRANTVFYDPRISTGCI